MRLDTVSRWRRAAPVILFLGLCETHVHAALRRVKNLTEIIHTVTEGFRVGDILVLCFGLSS